MSLKKPVSLYPTPTRINCPVCGKVTYSPGGVHPQCAASRASSELREAMKANPIILPAVVKKAWTKVCPECKGQNPARNFTCKCGHRFGSARASDGAAPEPTPATRPPRG